MLCRPRRKGAFRKHFQPSHFRSGEWLRDIRLVRHHILPNVKPQLTRNVRTSGQHNSQTNKAPTCKSANDGCWWWWYKVTAMHAPTSVSTTAHLHAMPISRPDISHCATASYVVIRHWEVTARSKRLFFRFSRFVLIFLIFLLTWRELAWVSWSVRRGRARSCEYVVLRMDCTNAQRPR